MNMERIPDERPNERPDESIFDLELEIARTQKALEELADENERLGVNEAIRQLCEEQERRMKEFFAEEEKKDLTQLGKPLKAST